ncbi:Pyridoxine/pyridoxamine 5'-phosphate oxidase 1, chloroplastic [Orobanche minor]
MASAKIAGDPDSISYLNQREAAEIDEILMGPLGFSVDQLMELAGLSVSTSIAEVYKPTEHNRVLAICGPGNNGGDGLVAARHLHHFGYKPFVCYPKRTAKALYNGLVTQLESLSVPFLSVEDLPVDLSTSFDTVVDAVFGFSFQALGKLKEKNQKSPSIVSLTAPKLCAKRYSGPHHFLGGRFVPPAIAEKFKLKLPEYPGTSMCVRIGKPPRVDISALRENYISPELSEDQIEADPFTQFQKWFDDAMAAALKEPNAMALCTIGKDGKPSSRMVLLKGFDKDGFVHELLKSKGSSTIRKSSSCSSVLLGCLKPPVMVRIEGPVQKVPDEESDHYFHNRPRGSQIGAIVSKQSSVIPGRQFLYQQQSELEAKYSDGLDAHSHLLK